MSHTVPGNLLQEVATYLIKRPPVRSGQPGMHQHVSSELIFHGPSRIAAKTGPVVARSHRRKNSVHTSHNVHILSNTERIQTSLRHAHRSRGRQGLKFGPASLFVLNHPVFSREPLLPVLTPEQDVVSLSHSLSPRKSPSIL